MNHLLRHQAATRDYGPERQDSRTRDHAKDNGQRWTSMTMRDYHGRGWSDMTQYDQRSGVVGYDQT
ncbi:hypothetical protein GJ744_006755 [Endocarpon pusillum]|uniref:Uncharacterized protein n=1 Tax=Endocarpon pusillum TaxID=364733 RepID=A0A8H7A7R5_9EURO|nr:hypothetical protein GJ744_006755 [Endocarpon pusillum]